MDAIITNNHFTSEEEAVAEIRAMGFHPLTIDVPAVTIDFHFHDFDSVTYMLEGALTVTERDSGETCTLHPGDKAEAKAGVVHRESHDGFRAVFGFSVPPQELTQPIDKPAE